MRIFLAALLAFLLCSQPAYAGLKAVSTTQGGGGGSVSITSASVPNIVVTPSPITGTGTINIGTAVATSSNNLGFFASTTSAQLAGVISDETGTGVLVFGTTPTFTTSITSPIIIGGTGTGSTLTLESTSGTGATDNIIFKTGSQSTVVSIGTQIVQFSEAAASKAPTVLSISTATFTPTFATGNDFSVTLVHASCPCTLANPTGPITPGQHGIIYIIQSATGSDTIGTWGSEYLSAGGTSTITLSTGANAIDVFSYAVQDATHIVLSAGALNVSH